MTKTMIKLTDLVAQHRSGLAPADLRVMQPRGRISFDVGTARKYFGGNLDALMVGESQGSDQLRGAYEWWPLLLVGRVVGELRGDACGLTIHAIRSRTRSPYRAEISGSSWAMGPVASFATMREARAWAEEYGSTADSCSIYDNRGNLVALHKRDSRADGTAWFRAQT